MMVARGMRKAPTPEEAFLWELVRDRRMLGLKFRRQHVLAGFILDFYCEALGASLEIDGGVHDDAVQRERDEDRTRVLERIGIHVVRIDNDALTRSRVQEIVGAIAAARALAGAGARQRPRRMT